MHEAAAHYEQAMRPRVMALQADTRGATRWYVPRSRGRELARNAMMMTLPNAVFRHYHQTKYQKV